MYRCYRKFTCNKQLRIGLNYIEKWLLSTFREHEWSISTTLRAHQKKYTQLSELIEVHDSSLSALNRFLRMFPCGNIALIFVFCDS